MKKRSEKKIKEILEGRIEPEEAIEFLKTMKDDDILDFFEKEKLSDSLEEYYSRNKALGIVPDLSKKKEDELWSRIVDEERVQVHQKTEAPSETFFDRLWKLFTKRLQPRHWYGAAAMALLVLVIIPFGVLQMTQEQLPFYHAMKGNNQGADISFEIARMVEGNILVRPDKPFTEDDIIAFQVKTDQEGFCSVYVVYGNSVDTVITDMSKKKGEYVLETVYNPKGNKGENIFVMQFTQNKLEINDNDRMQMVMNAAGKSLSKIEVDGQPVFFKFLNIVVD